MSYELVLLRHGQSTWNLENRFTGWVDVDLSEKGVEEAQRAARWLHEEGWAFDRAFTSFLKRAIRTLWITLDGLDQMWVPVERYWELNERHYGGLTGLDKQKSVEDFGEKQVHEWRRSYDVRPPAMDRDDPRHPRFDRRYVKVPPERLPDTECLKDCLARVLPCWEQHVAPRVRAGERVLVAAHGNSLRALVKHLDDVSDDEISDLNIPTGFPLVYELDEDLKGRSHRYLGPEEALRAAVKGVADQTSGKG